MMRPYPCLDNILPPECADKNVLLLFSAINLAHVTQGSAELRHFFGAGHGKPSTTASRSADSRSSVNIACLLI
jgi:hypothetical protein